VVLPQPDGPSSATSAFGIPDEVCSAANDPNFLLMLEEKDCSCLYLKYVVDYLLLLIGEGRRRKMKKTNLQCC